MEKENHTCPYCGHKLPDRSKAKKKYILGGIGACLLLIVSPFCNSVIGTIGNLIPSAILCYVAYTGYKDLHFCPDCGEILKDEESKQKTMPHLNK